jgi:RNA polymerase sigma-70 factor, ECF subfamily
VRSADHEFDTWYLDCRDRLVMQVAAMCGDQVEAMDFVQEAFVRAWSRWPRVSALDDPEGWVRRVAVNLAISRWRRARTVILQAVVRPAGSHESGEHRSDERAVMFAALATLPVEQRQAIVLHHLADLSVDEVAREMSVPAGTVKSWLSRGRSRMATALTDAPEEVTP